MQNSESSLASSSLRTATMSNRSKTRLYYAACICLLLVAVCLRFYNLSGSAIGYEEAWAGVVTRSALAEVFTSQQQDARVTPGYPILHPLVLHAVQKVDRSPLGVRIVPAVASFLTVAALLFLLPRVGVSRYAAFAAALLSTVSIQAIYHAQDAREYSVDVLVAVLMIVGLLSYRQGKHGGGGGTYVLFCVALFTAPLVQYGLVLFGIAVFGTIAVVEGRALWSRRDSLRDGLQFPKGWVWNRLVFLVGPTASFAAGSIISYATTLRHQWSPYFSGGLLSNYYYQGDYSDVRSIIEFALNNTWTLVTFHMLEFVAIGCLAAFGASLIVSIRRAKLDAVQLLFLLSIAVAICAALLGVYPYGGIRQCMYLAPIVFLAFGYALHSMAVHVSTLTRRARLAHAGMALAACVIAISGIAAIVDSDVYRRPGINAIISTLEEQAREGDVVYVTTWFAHMVEFYQKDTRDRYCYGDWSTGDWTGEPFRACASFLFRQWPDAERMWLILSPSPRPLPIIETLFAEGENIDLVRSEGGFHLYLWKDPYSWDPIWGQLKEEFDALTSAYQRTATRSPAAQSIFDIHVWEGNLIYVREPCIHSDAAARFFLHVVPADLDDLSDDRKQYGFDNLDFDFASFGLVDGGRCVAIRDLPEYDIDGISTGQFSEEDGEIWRGKFTFTDD